MNWLQSIRHRYSVKVFLQRAKKVSFPRAFVDLEHANAIGFIVNIEQFSADDLVYFTKYITHLEDREKGETERKSQIWIFINQRNLWYIICDDDHNNILKGKRMESPHLQKKTIRDKLSSLYIGLKDH